MKVKHYYIIAAVLLIAAYIIAIFSGVGTAYAATSDYAPTNVLTDLKTDPKFNVSNYPANNGDYSLQVIQVAESTDGELLLYVYQPAAGKKLMQATCINMSLSDNVNATRLYNLTALSLAGVFHKYKVNGVNVSSERERHYNITSIYRAFDETIDKKPGYGNTVSEVAFEVAQHWIATTENGSVKYTMLTSEVIEIKNKYVGYVMYDDGVNLGWALTKGATSAHFVAFSTDKSMDKLLSASLTFNEREVSYRQCCNPIHVGGHIGWGHVTGETFDFNYGDKTEHEPNPLELHYTEKASNRGNKYTWNRIQTTSEFLNDKDENSIKLTQNGNGGLDKTQWVLNFYETAVNSKADNVWLPVLASTIPIAGIIAAGFSGDVDVNITEVSDVTILRLEFEKDGKTYNLGAVDNKQTGSQEPINEPDTPTWVTPGITNNSTGGNVGKWLKSYWWVIPVGLLGLVLVGFLLYALAPLIGSVLKWLITLPFRFLKRLFGGDDGENNEEEEPKPKKRKKKRG